MGFFDFVKGAGEKLFGKDEPEEAAKVDPEKPAYDPAFVADQLRGKVAKLGLPIDRLDVGFADGVATVRGEVPNHAVAEKVVIQLGNTTIVERVDNQLSVRPPPVVEQAPPPPCSTRSSVATRSPRSPSPSTETGAATRRSSRPTSPC